MAFRSSCNQHSGIRSDTKMYWRARDLDRVTTLSRLVVRGWARTGSFACTRSGAGMRAPCVSRAYTQ
eukprot:1510967-Pleurochrysis_carterae.AAC.1